MRHIDPADAAAAKRVDDARRQARYSIRALARATGITPSTLAKRLNPPTPDYPGFNFNELVRIAQALDIDWPEFIASIPVGDTPNGGEAA